MAGCDPFWSALNAACSDEFGNYVDEYAGGVNTPAYSPTLYAPPVAPVPQPAVQSANVTGPAYSPALRQPARPASELDLEQYVPTILKVMLALTGVVIFLDVISWDAPKPRQRRRR